MKPEYIIQIVGIIVASVVAILVATKFSSEQNKNVLKQNLKIKTYEMFWDSIQNINNALATFPAKSSLNLGFLKQAINSPPNFREEQPDFDYRRRKKILSWINEYNDALDDIARYQLVLHQLWEQYEPVLFRLSTAFETYLSECKKFNDKTSMPVVSPWDLDITDFEDTYKNLYKQTEDFTTEALNILVYGIDLGRLIQKELLTEYFDFSPVSRGYGAEEGYELTILGLRPVKSIKNKQL